MALHFRSSGPGSSPGTALCSWARHFYLTDSKCLYPPRFLNQKGHCMFCWTFGFKGKIVRLVASLRCYYFIL